MLADFDDQIDKEHVNRNGPWSFDKQLILIHDFEGEMKVSKIKILCIYDLPLKGMNVSVGKMIGE